jgi:hypothetical protein
MSMTDQFLLALNAYQEIQAELHPGQKPALVLPQEPDTGTIITSTPLLPPGTLLLGLAEDGLPVMLDLYDPTPGPLLVAGDGGCGKTTLLQSLARLSDTQDPGDIQFTVLTPFLEEWTSLERQSNCLGVWPAYHPSAGSFLSQLVGWADALAGTRQSVLLLFDGFDLMAGSDFQYQHDLRWLLMYGPERHIWPVLSVNPARLARLQAWLPYFHTRVLGQVRHAHNARQLVNDPAIDLASLEPGKQFGLSQSGGWLKFWLPPLDDISTERSE